MFRHKKREMPKQGKTTKSRTYSTIDHLRCPIYCAATVQCRLFAIKMPSRLAGDLSMERRRRRLPQHHQQSMVHQSLHHQLMPPLRLLQKTRKQDEGEDDDGEDEDAGEEEGGDEDWMPFWTVIMVLIVTMTDERCTSLTRRHKIWIDRLRDGMQRLEKWARW